jgi:hypothetical protein
MTPFPGRGRDGTDRAVPRRVEHVEQARFANARWPGDGRYFPIQRLSQLVDPLTRFCTEVVDRVDLLVAAKKASRGRRLPVRPGGIKVHLVDANERRQVSRLRHHQKPVEQAEVWLRIPHGKEEERLVRVRQDDLLDVIGVTGEAGKRARSRCDGFDAPLPFSDISYVHLVPDGDEVSAAAVPLEDALDRGEHFSTVRQLHGEELAVGADDHARQRVHRESGILFFVSRIIG